MVAALAISAVATVASTVQASRIASKQAAVAQTAAEYNAKVDIANAQQLELDSAANIQRQRTENKSYLSSQKAAYAASGILSDTGSAMAVQATTAGRQEQDIQNYHRSVQQKESSLYAAAAEGRAEGASQAELYHLQGTGAIFQGVGQLAGLGSTYAQYKKGL